MSDVLTSSPIAMPVAATRQNFPSITRSLKVCVALGIGAAGLYGLASDSRYVSTTDAVVSAYVLDVRTPIEGVLRDVPATAGDDVGAGTVLAHVGNALVDRQHLDNLKMTEEVAQSRADALARERGQLEKLRDEMRSRVTLHTAATSKRLVQQMDEANGLLVAKQTALQEATLELNRGQALVGFGVISRAAFDKLQLTQVSRANEVRAQQAVLSSVETELGAARKGVLSEPGTYSDVAYSAQRADEVTIKLLENAGELEAAQAQAREAHRAVDVEKKRSVLMESSVLLAPSAGRLWKLHSVSGEHVEADAPVLSMVDCSRQFVIAKVPQDRISAVVLNGEAELKLTGESFSRAGRIMSVSGDSRNELDGKLAIAPTKHATEDLATVTIRLDAGPRQAGMNTPCLVGRTARVRIPTQPTRLFSLWLSQRL